MARSAHALSMTLTPHCAIRVTTKERREFLLSGLDPDPYFYNGVAYKVKWKNLGGGVWEGWLENKECLYNKIFDDAKAKQKIKEAEAKEKMLDQVLDDVMGPHGQG